MKFLTHSYVITIYEDGKFCWKNKGWIKNDTTIEFFSVLFWFLILSLALTAALINK